MTAACASLLAACLTTCAPAPCSRPALLQRDRCLRLVPVGKPGWVVDTQRQRPLVWRVAP